MILTCKIKHNQNFDVELAKAKYEITRAHLKNKVQFDK